MRKISFLIIICAILCVSLAPVARAQPQPGGNCTSLDSNIINDWRLVHGNVVNRIGLRDTNRIQCTKHLEISYVYRGTGRLSGWWDREWQNAKVYQMAYDTNYPEFNTGDYADIYYVIITNDNEVLDIVVSDNSAKAYAFWLNNSKDNIWRFKQAAKKRSKIRTWVSEYLNQAVPPIRDGKVMLTIVSDIPDKTDCEGQFNQLRSELNNFWSLVADFGQNPNQKYWRGKNTWENIGNDMVPYQKAIGELKDVDVFGFLGALFSEHEVEMLVFEPAGKQKLDEAGTIAANVDQLSKSLEENCKDYIDNEDNYPIEIRGINPEITIQFKNWGEYKEHISQVAKMAEVLGKTGTDTVPGPLSEKGIFGDVLETLTEWLQGAIKTLGKWIMDLLDLSMFKAF